MNKEEFLKIFEQRASKPLEDSDKNLLEGVFEAVRQMNEGVKTVSKEDVEAQIRKAAESFGISSEERSKIASALADLDKIKTTNLRKAIDERFNLRKTLEDNKADIVNAVRNQSVTKIEFRAAAIHKTTNTATSVNGVNGVNTFSDNYVIDDEIAFIRYPENFILNMISSRQVSKVPETIVGKSQKTREGEAEIVVEGGLKPLVSYTFEDKIYKRLKAAAHMEFTEEFEMDFERLYNDILDLFERDVLRDYQDKVYDAIITAAPGYVSTAMDGQIVDPDMYAVIGAGLLSLEQLNFNGNVIAMHPATLRLMQFAQASDGHYKVPPIAVGDKTVAGLQAYASTKVEPGKILIGDSSTWREEHSAFQLRFGYINEQFIHNEKSVVGEVFFIMRQHDRDKGSWIYLDIEAVKAALLKSDTPVEG